MKDAMTLRTDRIIFSSMQFILKRREEEKRRTVRYTPEGNGFLGSAIPIRGE
jgi:hypothetical protein